MTSYYAQVVGTAAAPALQQAQPAQPQSSQTVPQSAVQVAQAVNREANRQTGKAVEDKRRAVGDKRVEARFAGKGAKRPPGKGAPLEEQDPPQDTTPRNLNGDFDIIA